MISNCSDSTQGSQNQNSDPPSRKSSCSSHHHHHHGPCGHHKEEVCEGKGRLEVFKKIEEVSNLEAIIKKNTLFFDDDTNLMDYFTQNYMDDSNGEEYSGYMDEIDDYLKLYMGAESSEIRQEVKSSTQKPVKKRGGIRHQLWGSRKPDDRLGTDVACEIQSVPTNNQPPVPGLSAAELEGLRIKEMILDDGYVLF